MRVMRWVHFPGALRSVAGTGQWAITDRAELDRAVGSQGSDRRQQPPRTAVSSDDLPADLRRRVLVPVGSLN